MTGSIANGTCGRIRVLPAPAPFGDKSSTGGDKCVDDKFNGFSCPEELVEIEGSGAGSGGSAGPRG
jgi:hypothetical protein